MLVDTTISQIRKHERFADVVGDARVLVVTVADSWPSTREIVEFPLNEGTVIYKHELQLDWRNASG